MVNPNINTTPEITELPPMVALADLVDNGFKVPNGREYTSPSGETTFRDREFGRVGDVVTGIESAEDFEVLEHLIVGKLSRQKLEVNRKRSPTATTRNEPADPLAWKLRPKSYHGELTNGSAMVIDEPGKEPGQGALTFLFVADTKVGHVEQAVTYRENGYNTGRQPGGVSRRIVRKFHPSSSFNAAELTAKLREENARLVALNVARDGLSKAFSAGLPGLGRR
jgi:hypothetical protein